MFRRRSRRRKLFSKFGIPGKFGVRRFGRGKRLRKYGVSRGGIRL